MRRDQLDRPVDPASDHILGPLDAPITLVEYGSYACSHCRTAHKRLADVRDQLDGRLRYVFRHRPLPGNELALRAAEVAERAAEDAAFWAAHDALMSRSNALTEDDVRAVAGQLNVGPEAGETRDEALAQARVASDIESSSASGVVVTPTFFINGRRYEGLWEESSFVDAMLGSLGHRVRSASLDFARWAPSAGLLLLLASVLAVVLTNSAAGPAFTSFWQNPFGFAFGAVAFQMSLLHWINDAVLTIFFFVVGLEIKREFTTGHLASRRSAALPVAAAIGGMAVPVLLYTVLIPGGPWSRGWGVPMATDTAFAVALIVMMGARVPVALRIFLTAAAIIDDIGAIAVVAIFYSGSLHIPALVLAGAATAALAVLNRAAVHQVAPYILTGIVLWAALQAGGLHATLAGVVLAMFVPTRKPPDLDVIMAQANAVLTTEAGRIAEGVLTRGPSEAAMRQMDAIHARLESPADRMIRTVSVRSNYFVLPLFALANAGVELSGDVLRGHGRLITAIAVGLIIGKPAGILAASALAVRLGIATKSDEYSWPQVAGAGVLAGIGFTMSLFIAGEAFPSASDFAAAKIAVFGAAVVSAVIGVVMLRRVGRPGD